MRSPLAGRARARVTLAVVALCAALAPSVLLTAPAGAEVSGVSVSATTYQAGITSANWTIAFETPSSLSGTASDTITITFPSGFDVSDAGVASVSAEFGCVAPPAPRSSGQSVTITLNGTCSGLTGPAAASVTITGISASVGTYPASSFTVATSQDATPVEATGSAIVVTAAPPSTSVSGVTFSGSSSVAGATHTTWTVGFTTSASGSLAAPGTINVTFPAGFVLAASPAVTFVTGFKGSCAGTTKGSTTGQAVLITLSGSCALASSHAATVDIAVKANPAANSYEGAVATSRDTLSASSVAFQVSAATVKPSFTSKDAATATQGVAFSFTVTAVGSPTPTITLTGLLPAGVSSKSNSNGTLTLSGTPSAGTGGESYRSTMTASNAAGGVGQSFTLTVVVPPSAPDVPTSVHASDGSGVGTAKVSWDAGADNGAPIESYLVTGTNVTKDEVGPSKTVTGTSAAFNGLTAGDEYTFVVMATNAVGTSSGSLASNVIVPVAAAVVISAHATSTSARASATTSPVSLPVPGGSSSAPLSVVATIDGAGSVTLSSYARDPLVGFAIEPPGSSGGSGGWYFDVRDSAASQPTSMSIKVCGVPGTEQVAWYDPAKAEPEPVSDVSHPVHGCLTITITKTTFPTLTELKS